MKRPAEDSSRKGCEALFSFKAHDKKLQSQAHMKITRLSRKTPPMRIADVDHSDMGNTSDGSMYSEQSLIRQCSYYLYMIKLKAQSHHFRRVYAAEKIMWP